MIENVKTRSSQIGTDKTRAEPAPYFNRNPDQDEPVKGNMVIPAILAIALAVVVVATFFEDEYDSVLTALSLSDYDSTAVVLTSEETANVTNISDTGEQSTRVSHASTTDTVTVTEQQIDEPATAAAETVRPIVAVDNAQFRVSSGQAPETSVLQAFPDTIPYFATPYGSMPYQAYNVPYPEQQRGMIANQREIWKAIENQRRSDREEMIESRRRAWLEAEAARRKHLANMHEFRTAVLKRIEQDRTDMRKQIQEMNEEMDKRRDEEESKIMEFRRRADRTEI